MGCLVLSLGNAVDARSVVFAIQRPMRLETVGASLLAMDVNENVFCLTERVVLAFFASKLAPTGA
jgi:hypothetical protein